VEVIGARLFRAKAKRRKARVPGESAAGDKAQYPLSGIACSGDGMVSKSVDLTRGGLSASAAYAAVAIENERTR